MFKSISDQELLSMVKKLNQYSDEKPLEPDDADEIDLFLSAPSTLSEQDGWVKVENQMIIVQDALPGGKKPEIEADPLILLKKNGKNVFGRTTVRSEDKLEWEFQKKRDPLFEITVSDDKMTAFLQIFSLNKYGLRLKSCPMNSYVFIEVDEDPNIVLEMLRLSDILERLDKMKISKNLSVEAIEREWREPTYRPIPVAFGKCPIESTDARLELYFLEQVQSRLEEVDGKVDFRNHLQIPVVEKGDVLARKFNSKEGISGYNVYAEVINPKPPKDIVIAAKENVELTSNGEVIALKTGRPRMTGTGIKYFDICTSYVVSGNVDIKTGNVIFSGDVVVYGDVLEGMSVESLGNVYVYGNVYRATITATGNIVVKGNVVVSNLYSGYYGVVFNRLYIHVRKLSELLHSLVESSKVLKRAVEARGNQVGIGRILQTLIESKYTEIPSVSKEIIQSISIIEKLGFQKMNGSQEMTFLKEKTQVFVNPISIQQIKTYSFISSVEYAAKQVWEAIEGMQEYHVRIDINQCNHSILKSNGDIIIHGEGVLHGDLYARGKIQFTDQDSVCRGGMLEAEDSIFAMEVGSKLSYDTLLKAGRKIQARVIYGGKVFVGKQGEEIMEPLRGVSVYLDPSHKLVMKGIPVKNME